MQISAMFRLMGGDGAAMYTAFRGAYKSRSELIDQAIAQYNPDLHEINNKILYPDEEVMYETGKVDEDGEPLMASKPQPITRIPLAIEKNIIHIKSVFAYGGGVQLEPTNPDSELFKRVEKNFYDSKLDLISKEVIGDAMASTQSAVIFYSPRVDAVDKFKFKYKVISPLKGDTLEPFFDEDTDDLIAFGRGYTYNEKQRYDLYVINDQGRVEIRRYEDGAPVLTDGILLMPDINGVMQEIEGQVAVVIQTPYTKLPIIYMELPQGECADIHKLRVNYERAFSRFWDQNDKTGDPILFGKGETISLPNKERAGKYIEGSADASLEYLTPENATESRQLQFKMAEEYLYSLCNSIKMDGETFKGAGLTSGEAIERYLTPLYLDAKEKQEGILGMFYQRMMNWLVHETRALTDGEDDLQVYVKFKKLSFRTADDQVTLAMTANGGLPVVDHKTSIIMAGLSADPQKTLENIQNEQNSNDQPSTGD